MNQGNRIEIVDRDGWRKEFPLQKPLIYVGSDAGNDVMLPASRGAGVEGRHLQLVAAPGSSAGYRAINLGSAELALGAAGERRLLPHSAIDVANGDRLSLGDFVLTFYGVPAAALAPTRVSPSAITLPNEGSSQSIGLQLSLPRRELGAAGPLEGTITVRNAGSVPGVQFRLELEGLDEDCYKMGSGPILFPNVEKGVLLRLNHPKRPGLPAGHHKIVVRATAPEAYPGEVVAVAQEIEILPFYHHSLRLLSTN